MASGSQRAPGRRRSAPQPAGQRHEVRVHVVGGVRAVARQRLAVVVPRHVLAVRDRVAVVVGAVPEADRQRVAERRRQLGVGEVAADGGGVGRLGVAASTLAGSSHPAASLCTCACIARHERGVEAGDRLGPRRPVEPVEQVALDVVEARLEVEDEVHLRLAGARRQHDVAEPDDLQLQPGVLLDGAHRRRVVVLGHRQAEGAEVLPQQRRRDRGSSARARSRAARGSAQPGLPSTVGSLRQFDTLGYGCDSGPGTSAVTARTGHVGGERHDAFTAADGVPCPDDRVGEVARAALGLRVADVRPRPHDAVGQDLRVLAEVRAFGRPDVALAEHQRSRRGRGRPCAGAARGSRR